MAKLIALYRKDEGDGLEIWVVEFLSDKFITIRAIYVKGVAMVVRELVEFKVRDNGEMWRDAHTILERYFDYADTKDIEYVAEILSDALLCEVRWSYAGSFQGHYVYSQKAREAAAKR